MMCISFQTMSTRRNISLIIPILNTRRFCRLPTSLGTDPVNVLFDKRQVSSSWSCPNTVGMVPLNSLLAVVISKDTNTQMVRYISYTNKT